MQVKTSSTKPDQLDVDVLCVGLFDPPHAPEWLSQEAAALVESGIAEGKPGQTHLAFAAAGPHTLLVGLGKESELTAEKARVAAAGSAAEAEKVKAGSIAWVVPTTKDEATIAAAITEGVILASYKFDRYLSKESDGPEKKLEELVVVASGDPSGEVSAAQIVSEAANAARDLQNRPGNDLTPTELAKYSQQLADEIDDITVEVLDRKALESKQMGAILSVAQGSDQEPRLIVMRYQPKGAKSKGLSFVGKAVTFDSGGISIKPSAKMEEMKMDMSGGAAAIEATAAIARLKLPIELTTVVASVENMPSGGATKPGDIVKTYKGKTVEITNTDAEGRMILADALAYAVELGAEKIVDLATLTGAVVVALGSTYAGLMSNNDQLAKAIEEAGSETGELVWRLPLHEEYFELTKGTVTDLVNSSDARKAGPIYAASFLEQFVDDTAWAHLDIAGTAWGVGRSYVGKGPSGFGVRLLVELARNS